MAMLSLAQYLTALCDVQPSSVNLKIPFHTYRKQIINFKAVCFYVNIILQTAAVRVIYIRSLMTIKRRAVESKILLELTVAHSSGELMNPVGSSIVSGGVKGGGL